MAVVDRETEHAADTALRVVLADGQHWMAGQVIGEHAQLVLGQRSAIDDVALGQAWVVQSRQPRCDDRALVQFEQWGQ
jgi:hypothetical protein